MLEQILIAINDMMLDEFWLALAGCFAWGIVSTLLSPCHVASIPLLVSYAAGQPMTPSPRHATGFAIVFSAGLFLAITLVGIICALLGRMLGDVPPWVYIAVGLLLIAVGVNTALVRSCSIPYGGLFRYHISGYPGAALLGFLYGLLSGVCTFGFLAPVLSVITIQHRVLQGIIMTLSFASGHCLPIAVIGSGVSLAEKQGYRRFSGLLKRLSSIIIIGIGCYFIVSALH